MGAVYLAEHPLIGKKVALKVIHSELSGNREVVQRFFQEARAVNKIGNDHIVQIHDFGVTPENDHFYIMEYLEGTTLASVLSKQPMMDIMRALHIGAQIANALAAAHAAGVVHRDLKPDNIMLMPRMGDPDFVKVLDFGLAKVFAEASAVKTAAGVLLGTPQYMSPEACESKRDIDHRTDIYALGILLFQMMTGRLPFDGESMGEVLVKQVTQLPPAPRGWNPAIPPSVEQILLRCLAKSPEGRFQTMPAMREALLDPEGYLRKSPPIAPARSVAPGEAKVDARTVVLHAKAVQEAKLAGLPPPPAPKLAVDQALTAPTMIGAGASGSIGDAGASRSVGGGPLRAQTHVPDLAPPVQTNNHTMRIATPIGYSSRPPRKMWPIVLVMGLLLGLGGGGFAVAWFGQKPAATKGGGAGSGDGSSVAGSASSAGAGSGGSAGSAGAGSGSPGSAAIAGSAAGSAGSGSAGSAALSAGSAGSAAGSTLESPVLAKLSIESVPPRATVVGPDGTVLGRTPLDLSWPVSDQEVVFELRLPGYRKKSAPLLVTGSSAIVVELERIPRATNDRDPGHQRGSGASDTGLMRPE